MQAEIIKTQVKPSKPQFDIITTRQQINCFLSGQGGGKTHCAGVVSGRLITIFPKAHGFIGANTHLQLTDSTLTAIRKVWAEKYLWTEFNKENPSGTYVVDVIPPDHFNTEGHHYDSYHGKISFKWGTVVYKGSLDNYKAHDGKEFGWAILDETKDTREEAVKEVIIGRLREHGLFLLDKRDQFILDEAGQKIPWNPLFIFTSPAKVKWINEWFQLDKHQKEINATIYKHDDYFKLTIDNKFITISSVYLNQENLPSNYIANQKSNLNSALQDMLIYGNPFSQSGGEYYPPFLRAKHVGGGNYLNPVYRKEAPLHNAFDFNVRPYMTSLQGQMELKDKIWWVYIISETLTKPPRSRTSPLCDDIAYRYRGHLGGGFIYGDHTKKNAQTGLAEGFENEYEIIFQKLRAFLSHGYDRVRYVLPDKRRKLLIDIMEEVVPIRLLIHSSCTELIDDLTYTKEDPNGGKYKHKVKDPITNKMYEESGHASDTLEYFLSSAFFDYIN